MEGFVKINGNTLQGIFKNNKFVRWLFIKKLIIILVL
jgi:hypothetical protein